MPDSNTLLQAREKLVQMVSQSSAFKAMIGNIAQRESMEPAEVSEQLRSTVAATIRQVENIAGLTTPTLNDEQISGIFQRMEAMAQVAPRYLGTKDQTLTIKHLTEAAIWQGMNETGVHIPNATEMTIPHHVNQALGDAAASSGKAINDNELWRQVGEAMQGGVAERAVSSEVTVPNPATAKAEPTNVATENAVAKAATPITEVTFYLTPDQQRNAVTNAAREYVLENEKLAHLLTEDKAHTFTPAVRKYFEKASGRLFTTVIEGRGITEEHLQAIAEHLTSALKDDQFRSLLDSQEGLSTALDQVFGGIPQILAIPAEQLIVRQANNDLAEVLTRPEEEAGDHITRMIDANEAERAASLPLTSDVGIARDAETMITGPVNIANAIVERIKLQPEIAELEKTHPKAFQTVMQESVEQFRKNFAKLGEGFALSETLASEVAQKLAKAAEVMIGAIANIGMTDADTIPVIGHIKNVNNLLLEKAGLTDAQRAVITADNASLNDLLSRITSPDVRTEVETVRAKTEPVATSEATVVESAETPASPISPESSPAVEDETAKASAESAKKSGVTGSEEIRVESGGTPAKGTEGDGGSKGGGSPPLNEAGKKAGEAGEKVGDAAKEADQAGKEAEKLNAGWKKILYNEEGKVHSGKALALAAGAALTGYAAYKAFHHGEKPESRVAGDGAEQQKMLAPGGPKQGAASEMSVEDRMALAELINDPAQLQAMEAQQRQWADSLNQQQNAGISSQLS